MAHRLGLPCPLRLFPRLPIAPSIVILVSMTGEITLRGRVLAVGGAGESVGGSAGGHQDLCFAHKNERDLEEIPEKLRQDLNFVLVKRMEDVLDVVLMDAVVE